jgi:predicted Ser/Thr protein kinase
MAGSGALAANDATMAGVADVTRLGPSDTRTANVMPGAPRYHAGEVLADRYRIVRLLGRGGMGEVYLVDDLRLSQQVALKFLPPALAADERRLSQFHSEVRIARQVSHPNVCRVYDIGEIDGELFLSMEYVEGTDLAVELQRIGKYDEAGAVELSRQICAGLAAAHDRGVLHRDLKPANIMINREGRAQVMDFGLAVVGKTDGVIEGSPAYMSPEQLAGKDLTIRSDLYAVGLIMYELFTGQRAFKTDGTLDDLARSRTSGTFAAPATIVRTINPEVNNAIRACLEPDPERRPVSAHAVSTMLQTQLLDASKSRVMQVALVAMGIFLVLLAVRTEALSPLVRLGLGIAGAAFLYGYLQYPMRWDLDYKGHRITFKIHPIWGERLYIDEVLVDRGRLGVHITLRGTIESGDGAGERITAKSRAAVFTLSCRIVVESFAATAR